MRLATVLVLVALPLSGCLCVPVGPRPCQQHEQCEDGDYCLKGERDSVGRCLSPGALRDAGIAFDDAGNPILDAGPEPPATIAADRVQVGSSYQCARTVEGELMCWGLNRQGRLGHDDDMLSNSPVAPRVVAGLGAVESFATGEEHACAIGVRGGERGVWCWGNPSAVGRASPQPAGAVAKPDLEAPVHAAAAEVTIGVDDTCVRTSGGDVWCWGPGSVTSSVTPEIAASFTDTPTVFHSAAVCADTGVVGLDCTDAGGALEVGCSQVGDLYRCSFLDGASDVAWSSSFVCFVDADNGLRCAGENSWGVVDPIQPLAGYLGVTTVDVEATAMRVRVGPQHACAWGSDGRVRCWGRNLWSAVGQPEGSGEDCHGDAAPWLCFPPTLVDGPVDVIDFDGFDTTSCAVAGNGDVWCWGRYNAVEGTLPTRVRLTR